MSEEQSIIVNEKDEIIGYKDRSEIVSSDIYRVTALWLENNLGEALLVQRAFTKKFCAWPKGKSKSIACFFEKVIIL